MSERMEQLKMEDELSLPRAVACLRAGGLVAFPTDTVYGLAADVRNAAAIERLFSVKGRDFNKAIAVLVGSLDDLPFVFDMSAGLPDALMRLAERFWPGALTLVAGRAANLPAILSPQPTLGVRMPNHAWVRQLLRDTGPLATTSANLSGAANPLSAEDVLDQLAERIDLLVDGGPSSVGLPSTVVDCTGQGVKILRQGAIPAELILRAVE